MMHQRRLAEVRKHLAANEHARSAVDNPQDNPHHLVLAHFDDYLRGEPGISHGAAGPIAGGNPWRSVSHAEENGAEATPATPFARGSPWVFVYAGVMPPGAGVGLHTHTEWYPNPKPPPSPFSPRCPASVTPPTYALRSSEEMFITLNNVCEFTHNNRT